MNHHALSLPARLGSLLLAAALLLTGCAKPQEETSKASSIVWEEITIDKKPALPVKEPWTKELVDKYSALSAATFEGDNSRLAGFIRKLHAGEEVTVGFIGGSITQGSPGPSSQKALYPRVFCDWLEYQFPEAKVNMINIGVGATRSLYGVHRIEGQLLYTNPDLVILEYSANDDWQDESFDESFESLCRKVLNWPSKPAVMTLSMCWQNLMSAQNWHIRSNQHYGIPLVSYLNAVSEGLRTKEITWNMLCDDDVHPNVGGHWFVAQLLIKRLEAVMDHINDYQPPDYTLPAPRTANRFENAGMLYANAVGNDPALEPVSLGSFKKTPFMSFFAFKNGWSCSRTDGEPLVLEVTGGLIAVTFLAFDAPFDIVVDKGTAQEKTFHVTKAVSAEAVNYLYVVEEEAIAKHTIEIQHGAELGKVYINGIMIGKRA